MARRTLESIEAEISRLKAQAEELRKKEREGVIGRIREAIKAYGITSEELGYEASGPAASKISKKRKSSASKKTARPAKFGDASGNTWSGMGKRPNWFKDALAGGATPEQLLLQ